MKHKLSLSRETIGKLDSPSLEQMDLQGMPIAGGYLTLIGNICSLHCPTQHCTVLHCTQQYCTTSTHTELCP
jgi:hypothetical protein